MVFTYVQSDLGLFPKKIFEQLKQIIGIPNFLEIPLVINIAKVCAAGKFNAVFQRKLHKVKQRHRHHHQHQHQHHYHQQHHHHQHYHHHHHHHFNHFHQHSNHYHHYQRYRQQSLFLFITTIMMIIVVATRPPKNCRSGFAECKAISSEIILNP